MQGNHNPDADGVSARIALLLGEIHSILQPAAASGIGHDYVSMIA
jgi:hypothetical protein